MKDAGGGNSCGTIWNTFSVGEAGVGAEPGRVLPPPVPPACSLSNCRQRQVHGAPGPPLTAQHCSEAGGARPGVTGSPGLASRRGGCN